MTDKANIIQLIKSRRSIRQFQQRPIPTEVLIECVDCARLGPSAMNLQPLEYMLVTAPELVERVFPLLAWAGYIRPYGNPEPGNLPVAYLIVLVNKNRMKSRYANDVGAAVENFILAAWSFGIGTCWIGTVERTQLRQLLAIPEDFEIDAVIACGYPAETPVLEEKDDDVRYWKDEVRVFHVPKRPLKSVLHINKW